MQFRAARTNEADVVYSEEQIEMDRWRTASRYQLPFKKIEGWLETSSVFREKNKASFYLIFADHIASFQSRVLRESH